MSIITQIKTVLILLLAMSLGSTILAQTEVPVTTNSQEALRLFVEGRTNVENLEFDKANQFFDQAIALDPDFALAYLYDALTLNAVAVVHKNLDKAMSLAGKASPGEQYLIKFYIAQENRDNKGMETALSQLLTRYPQDKRVQVLAGSYFYGRSDYNTAIEHFKKSLDRDKNYAPAYNMLGYAEMANGNFAEAEKSFQSYIRLIPDKPNPYDSYGEMLLKQGKYDESIRQYENAIGKDPHFTSAYLGIASDYIFKGDAASAMSYYHQLYDHTQDIDRKLAATYGKAIAYIHMNKFDEAIRTLEMYERIAEVDNREDVVIQAKFSAGLLYRDTPNPEEGLKLINSGMNLIQHSNLPESVKENLSFYGMANRIAIYAAMRKYDLAGYDINRCRTILKETDDPFQEKYLSGVMGYYEFNNKDFNKALTYFQKADTENPLNLYYIGLIYEQKGDADSAHKMYTKVANWNQNSLTYATVRNKAIMKTNSVQ